jgi:hypothetical protein
MVFLLQIAATAEAISKQVGIIDFESNFMIIEVCNPQKAKEVLTKI